MGSRHWLEECRAICGVCVLITRNRDNGASMKRAMQIEQERADSHTAGQPRLSEVHDWPICKGKRGRDYVGCSKLEGHFGLCSAGFKVEVTQGKAPDGFKCIDIKDLFGTTGIFDIPAIRSSSDSTAKEATVNKAQEKGDEFIRTGVRIGKIVKEKNAKYGDSFAQAGAIMRILYPNGISLDQYDDALAVIRVVDKLFRIATDRDALGESPWDDLGGYANLRSTQLNPVI